MPRRRQAMELPFMGKLDRTQGELGRQLTRVLREAIRSGELKPGESLPSTRHLAETVGISRGLVTNAFEQLIAEGFLEAQAGSSTRVSRSLSALLSTLPASETAGQPRKTSRTNRPSSTILAPTLPPRAAAFADVARQFTPLPPVPFAVSVPIGPTAPDDTWRKLGNRTRGLRAAAPSGYDDPQGVPALRAAIADYVRKSRSVHCTPGQVIITAGTQQGLYLACQILLEPADRAWVEDPAYRGITGILEATGNAMRMVRVPVDESGIDVEAGIRKAPDARVAFVTPSHQYPLGMPLSMARRTALVAWARANDAWIIEDDYDSELRYVGHPFPSLQGLAPDRVIYLGTFSKILFPSLRLGYAIVPEHLVPSFCGARGLMDRHPPSADQHTLAAYIAEGYLDRHIRRVRLIYAERREHLISTIASRIPSSLAWLQPGDQGMHLVLWLAAPIDDLAVAAQAMAAGVAVRAVSPLYAAGNGRPGLILGLGGYTDAQTEAAVDKLGAIIAAASGALRPRKRRVSAKTIAGSIAG
ncbi:PLP-dependent aminotransferase family protein [Cupriavidus plantarum]|uniref:MocR-like pyridoxine biosynthesis transcription factor PdxR n=1 Tax=Cupriavidus plantarum TaxID=942865 RepID=UPI0015CCCD66|nr:PLP-dependent aminotransferase family protein [Cupriavidus plantarum]NYI02617.1 GntR family transcriptional regulator/MocR family aminotransferase [Cupriavidus plantarum]